MLMHELDPCILYNKIIAQNGMSSVVCGQWRLCKIEVLFWTKVENVIELHLTFSLTAYILWISVIILLSF